MYFCAAILLSYIHHVMDYRYGEHVFQGILERKIYKTIVI